MLPGQCASCTPPRAPNIPKRRSEATVHSSGSVSPSDAYGFVVVDVKGGQKRADFSMKAVDRHTTMVHFTGGLPYLWAFEEVLKRAPNLKMIQVIPSMLPHCNPNSHLRICAARGVELRAGHVRPESVWGDGRAISPQFDPQRRFMTTLAGSQKALFDELLLLGFDSAEMAKRYFLLDGGEVISQSKIAKEFGFPEAKNGTVSAKVLSVLYYLDDSVVVGEEARRRARTMREKVARLRDFIGSANAHQRLLDELGLPKLADNFPLARADVLRALLHAPQDRLELLRTTDPQGYKVLTLRFGLEELDQGVYRTLKEVGEALGGFTREWARQLEERALAALGIVED